MTTHVHEKKKETLSSKGGDYDSKELNILKDGVLCCVCALSLSACSLVWGIKVVMRRGSGRHRTARLFCSWSCFAGRFQRTEVNTTHAINMGTAGKSGVMGQRNVRRRTSLIHRAKKIPKLTLHSKQPKIQAFLYPMKSYKMLWNRDIIFQQMFMKMHRTAIYTLTLIFPSY